MTYLISLLIENYNKPRLRAFASEDAARSYVERLAVRLVRRYDPWKRSMFVQSAELFFCPESGLLRPYDLFMGDEEGGEWEGAV